MTAENVLKNVLPEIGIDNATAQLSGTDFEIVQIRSCMNAAGKEINARVEWSRASNEQIIAGDISEVALAADFHRMAEKGAVRLNKAGFYPVVPVVAPEQWEFLSSRPSAQPYYHLSGGKILFSPVLDVDGAKVRYVSKNWVEGDKDEVTQNGDNLLIPERLLEKGTICRWKRQKGLPFDDLLAEFEADLITEISADRGAG